MSEPEERDFSTAYGGSPLPNLSPTQGRGAKRKQPRWTIPFLRALERTGNARASAEEAGVDHTTAYLRRRTHAGFAADWEWVLEAYAERVEREREAELERFSSVTPPPAPPHPGEASLGSEL